MTMKDTSIDMSMVPLTSSFWESLVSLVNSGKVSEERIDLSVRRVLSLKEALGLLDSPVPSLQSPLLNNVGSEEDKESCREAAREAVTLLKNEKKHTSAMNGNDNEKVLPLDRLSMNKVLVVGPSCDSLVLQSGGWTHHWQGAYSEEEFVEEEGITILEGIKTISKAGGDGSDFEVVNMVGVSIEGHLEGDRDKAIAEAVTADAVVVCIGEGAYAEKPGDISDLSLPSTLTDLVIDLEGATSDATPVILVLVQGRPRLLHGATDSVDAILNAYLPGPWGGEAIAEIIFGKVNPSGRLPLTYPKHQGSIPLPYHHVPSQLCSSGEGMMSTAECEVEWWFGHGLSYTQFVYSNLAVKPAEVSEGDSFTVTLLVENAGSVEGKESVLLFCSDLVRRVAPHQKLLKGFKKITTQPGEKIRVTFELSTKELEYIGVDKRPVLEEGVFLFGVGPEVDCRTDPNLCVPLTLKLSDEYHPICEAACELWFPSDTPAPGGYICPLEHADTFPNKKACLAECAEAGNVDILSQWGWDYVSCLEQSVWTGRCGFNTHCRSVGAAAIDSDSKRGGTGGTGGTSVGILSRNKDRVGSIDLALGVAVGLVVGGAAMLVVIMFFRRRWLDGLAEARHLGLAGGRWGGVGADGRKRGTRGNWRRR
ncbi:unnamed protein product, partial [Choristocarpus tenellus]